MKRILGLVGLLIFVTAVIAGFVSLASQQRAQSHDNATNGFGIAAGDVLPCAWEVTLPQRVLSENKSQTIVVNVTNAMDVDCKSALTLLAPGFDISPRKDEQIVEANANSRGSVAWIVTPDKAGEYEIAVTDGIDTRVMGVTVTNLFGLTAIQIQIFAVIGSVLGPMLSVPWWWERAQQRKKARPQTSAQ
jgi:hypothetical protein